MTSTIESEANRTTHNDAEAGVSPKPSSFCWYELHTPDATAAAQFYAPVLGWNMQDSGMTDRRYTLVCVDKTPVGGLMEKQATGFTKGEGARWMAYIGVNDVERYAKLVPQAGGVIHRAPEEIPGVGTFAVAADPQGAIFTLFQPLPGVTPPEQPPLSTPGMPVWHELVTADFESAFRFYSGLFGWTLSHTMDMGPNGKYHIFAAGSQPTGGMMAASQPAQDYGWSFCFQVQQIEAAMDRVKENGGLVPYGAMEVPGGQQVAHCRDAQGAPFSMVGPSRK